MSTTPEHVSELLERIRSTSNTPSIADVGTWLNELDEVDRTPLSPDLVRTLEGLRLRLQAMEHALTGDEETALSVILQAINIFRGENSESDLARALLLEGNYFLALGRFSTALSAYEEALQLFTSLNDQNGRARVIGNMGTVYNFVGDYDRALKCYQEATHYHELTGDMESLARTTGGMGLVAANTSDYPTALQHLTKALDIHRSRNARREEARTLSSLGNVYRVVSDYPKSLEFLQKAHAIIEDIGEKKGLARVLMNLAGIYGDMHDYERELATTLRALAINEQTNDAATHPRLVGDLASTYMILQQFDIALEHINRAIEESDQLGLTSLAYSQRVVRSSILFRLGRIDEAEAEATRCYETASLHRSLADTTQALVNLGDVWRYRGDPISSRRFYEEALVEAMSSGQRSQASNILNTLSELMEDHDPRAALDYHRRSVALESSILGERQKHQIAVLDMEQRLSEEHKLHEQHRGLLLDIMPAATVSRILDGEKLIADTYDDTSVMFLDIVGFTGLASRAPANQLVHVLNAVFERCDEIGDRHGLSKIKTIGDAYLAIAGMPEIQEDHADRIANAALSLQHHLRSLNVTIPSHLGNSDWIEHVGDLEVRIGLHCGPLVAGVIGKKRAQFDVWGDTVNVASRMESTSQPGKIQVSDAFAVALGRGAPPTLDGADVVIRREPFLLRLRGSIDIKGKGEMKTWWLELISG